MSKKNMRRNKRKTYKKIKKVPVYENCNMSRTCIYVNTCPTMENRICNSTAKYCRRCVEGAICNMRKK